MLSKNLQKQIKNLADLLNRLKESLNFHFHSLRDGQECLINAFSCGDEDLDSFIKSYALSEQRKHLSRVFVGLKGNELISFYSLSAIAVEQKFLPKNIRPNYPKVPAVLIGRFGVSNKFQKKGFGKLTMKDLLRRYLKVCQIVGSMALVVESYQDSEGFYKKYGFQLLQKHGERRTYYLLTTTIIKEFGDPSRKL